MSELVLYTTDQLRDLYLRDFSLRMPSASTARGTAPYIDAVTVSGVAPAMFKNAGIAAERALIASTFGDDLTKLAKDRQRPRLNGTGSFTTGKITTATTGANIPIGSLLKHKETGEPFQTTSATAVYFTGNTLGVKSVGIGRQTNVEGTLIFQSPSAGLAPEFVLDSKAIGGTDVEEDVDVQLRLQSLLDTPPADGNIGSYIDLCQSPSHGIPVDDVLLYPSIVGAGSIGVTFTIRGTGLSRIPTAPQLSVVETFLKANVPADDCIFMLAISPQAVSPGNIPILGIKFISGENGFIDQDQFPKYNVPVGAISWSINSTPTPTAVQFGIKSSNGSYSGSGIRNGQTIALWDSTNKKFVNKRILSFTGTGPYTVTVDQSTNVSNTTYVPITDQYVSPWSDKLNDLAVSIVSYYDNITPGENTSFLPDPGLRMRRFPADGILHSYGITTRILDEIDDRTDIQNATVLAGLTSAPTVGTPGVNVFMLVLKDLAIYGILWLTFPYYKEIRVLNPRMQ